MHASSLLVLASAGLVAAHFGIDYPIWRADSLNNESYSQYTYPCANVPTNLPNANRTDWPTTGGSIALDLHHNWSYVFINIGLGDNITNFNYTLTPNFYNVSGSGTLCLPSFTLPSGLAPADGQHATLQVITLGTTGTSLYNCADITFRTNATLPYGGAGCTTSDEVTYYEILQQSPSNASGSATSSAAPATATSAGVAGRVDSVLLSTLVALAMGVVYISA